mmetsp:Transcript_52377/g.117664  ORF Transcript_52377/g.117664 Transcript_52377/m.117664 type:complete len:215 (+) Transcript_52377:669-1313(+)
MARVARARSCGSGRSCSWVAGGGQAARRKAHTPWACKPVGARARQSSGLEITRKSPVPKRLWSPRQRNVRPRRPSPRGPWHWTCRVPKTGRDHCEPRKSSEVQQSGSVCSRVGLSRSVHGACHAPAGWAQRGGLASPACSAAAARDLGFQRDLGFRQQSSPCSRCCDRLRRSAPRASAWVGAAWPTASCEASAWLTAPEVRVPRRHGSPMCAHS